MSGTIANHLGERKTKDLHWSLVGIERARRRKLHPHEHKWQDKAATVVPEIACALVSGWIGQGRVAVRFVGQQDTLWHMYTYPYPHNYLGTAEDPWTNQSNPASSSASDYKSLKDQDTYNRTWAQTNTT